MGASAVLQRPGIDLASLNLNVPSAPPLPIPGYNTAREAQYARRVKELEDELNTTRSELVKVVRLSMSFSLYHIDACGSWHL